ncbi:hypothetical protein Ancab_034406 [Ancistrocladus abbreviatus]
MESSKPLGSYSSSSSSSSSIAVELFGPKDASSSSSSSIFGSVFGPPPTVKGRYSSNLHAGNQTGNAKHGISAHNTYTKGQSTKENSSYYQQETVGPCYFSSSIYYGGQEVYSPATCTTDSPSFKKDEQDDDLDGGNAHSASRGNWWQGSLYY